MYKELNEIYLFTISFIILLFYLPFFFISAINCLTVKNTIFNRIFRNLIKISEEFNSKIKNNYYSFR